MNTNKKKILSAMILYVIVIVNIVIIMPVIFYGIFGDSNYIVYTIFFQLFGILLPAICFIRIYNKNSEDEISIEKLFVFNTKNQYHLFIIIGVILGCVSILMSNISDIIYFIFFNSKPLPLEYNVGFFEVLLGIITFTLITPVCEDIFFKGILYRVFEDYKEIVIVIVPSILFVFAHLIHYGVADIIVLCFLSCISMFLVCKTKSLISSIIVHGVFNMIVFIRNIFKPISSISNTILGKYTYSYDLIIILLLMIIILIWIMYLLMIFAKKAINNGSKKIA